MFIPIVLSLENIGYRDLYFTIILCVCVLYVCLACERYCLPSNFWLFLENFNWKLRVRYDLITPIGLIPALHQKLLTEGDRKTENYPPALCSGHSPKSWDSWLPISMNIQLFTQPWAMSVGPVYTISAPLFPTHV